MDRQRTESFSLYRKDDRSELYIPGTDVSYGYPWISSNCIAETGGTQRRGTDAETGGFTGNGKTISV